MRWLTALFLGLGVAFAEIAAPLPAFFSTLKINGTAGKPLNYGQGHLQVDALAGRLYKVRYVGPVSDLEDAGRVIAAAVGAPEAKEAFTRWFRANRSAIAAQGRPVRVGLGRSYVLELAVAKDLRFEVAPLEVPEAAFGKPRHLLGYRGPLIREFSDFYCPYCERLALQVFPKIKAELIEKGMARFDYRHFPLVEIHPDAIRAALASECAAEQKKFWPYHDALFAALAKDHSVDYTALAREQGLDPERFATCLAEARYQKTVEEMRAEAERLGLNGTPTVFVGPFLLPNPFDLKSYRNYLAMAAALGTRAGQ